MDKRIKEILVATLAVGAAAVSVYFAWAGRAPKINLDPYDVLGAVTAEETAKLLGNKGRVLVVARDTGVNKNPSVEAELKAFQHTLKRQPGIKVVTEQIQISPNQMMATGGGVPPELFLKALATHAPLDAVVLFLGFPQLSDPELDALKTSGIKTVVACALRPGDQRLLERQAIHLAIVPRSDPQTSEAPAPRTLRERFDQQFSILTPPAAARSP
ncbi:MAG: hypothetical protein NT154_25075 [Verrucomicrobia bacterium]|nr:hypothetical protein [Verrucomicrobiota bacterium]